MTTSPLRRAPGPWTRRSLIGLVAVLAGCSLCPDVPHPDRYFPADRPEWALAGFVYAVETEQWDAACSRLSARTLEKVSCLELSFGLDFADPRTGIPFREIIVGSISDREVYGPDDEGSSDAVAYVAYEAQDEDGATVVYDIRVRLILERGPDDVTPLWKVDLVGTLEEIAGLARR